MPEDPFSQFAVCVSRDIYALAGAFLNSPFSGQCVDMQRTRRRIICWVYFPGTFGPESRWPLSFFLPAFLVCPRDSWGHLYGCPFWGLGS